MQIQNRNFLVTGGAGFIGSRVVRELSEAGANVLAIDNGFSGSDSLIPDDIQFKQIDIRSDRLEEVVLDFDPNGIVHLAAIHYIPYCNKNPEEAFDVNVMGTRNILDAARKLSNLETFVFASSAAVYPPQDEAHTESGETGPMDIYGETKLVGEDLMKLYNEDEKIPTAAVRLFNVYGPNETNDHLVPAVLKQVQQGDRQIELGNLSPKRDFIHVTDVANAITTLLKDFDGSFRTFNVGTGTEYSVREVVEQTSTALGEEIEIVQDEERIRDSDRPHLKADISRLRTEFNWEPNVDFVTGLEDLLDMDQVLVE